MGKGGAGRNERKNWTFKRVFKVIPTRQFIEHNTECYVEICRLGRHFSGFKSSRTCFNIDMACTLFTLYFTECVHSGSLQFVFTVPMGGWCFQKPRSAQEFGEDLDNEPRGYCTVRDQSSKCISTSLFSAFKSIRCPFPLVKTKCLLGCRSERRSPPMMMLTSVLLKNTRGPFSLTKRK